MKYWQCERSNLKLFNKPVVPPGVDRRRRLSPGGKLLSRHGIIRQRQTAPRRQDPAELAK
jgi:hypothetical protein